MNNNIMKDFNDPRNWKRTSKKNYEVYVCRPNKGTKVSNRLEGSNYVTDENKQFVISGTVGETWVIDIGKLAKTYCFMDGMQITSNSLKTKMRKDGLIDWMHLKTLPGGGGINWAFHLPLSIKNFPVQTSWGDTLYANRDGVGHGVGDFLVCSDMGGQPNLNDVWVVNGEVFPTTYDMRAFPGLVPAGTVAETPKPASILGEISEKSDKKPGKFDNEARNMVTRLVNYYTKYAGCQVSNINIGEVDKGRTGNYQMLEDHTYYDYNVTAMANGVDLKMCLSFIEDDDSRKPPKLNIFINDGTHSKNLYYYKDSYDGKGIVLHMITDEVLKNYFDELFGLNQNKKDKSNSTKTNRKGFSGLFDMFKR